MLWSECFFYLYVCREWQSADMHTWYLRVFSAAPFAPRWHSFPLLSSFVFFLFPRGPSRNQNTCVLCTLHISVSAVVCGGTWTVIPAENNTSFHPVKPSVRPHHGEQALRIHDIISLPGRVFSFNFPPQHCTVVRSLRCGAGKEKWELGDSAEAVNLCVAKGYLEN